MRSFVTVLVLSVMLLSGCATYKFDKGKGANSDGFVVSRDQYTLLEYTAGPDNKAAPTLTLAKERFGRRRFQVEHYYKQMGYIRNRFLQIFWDNPAMLGRSIVGFFQMPFKWREDVRYQRDAQYREQVRAREAIEEKKENDRLTELKILLAQYVRQDLKQYENLTMAEVPAAPAAPAPVASAPAAPEASVPAAPVETGTTVIESAASEPAIALTPAPATPAVEPPATKSDKVSEALAKLENEVPSKKPLPSAQTRQPALPKPVKGDIQAVITANPIKGYSPLKVFFSAGRSRSPFGRIIAYEWDFGDGDKSSRRSATNTFWSTSYEPKFYTVGLTVTDDKGNSSTTTQLIEVINP